MQYEKGVSRLAGTLCGAAGQTCLVRSYPAYYLVFLATSAYRYLFTSFGVANTHGSLALCCTGIYPHYLQNRQNIAANKSF